MAFADKTLTCRDCGTQFTFTEGEQQFYQSKGLMNEPTRCPDCRAARKRSQGDGGYAGTNGGYSRSSGPREMFEVTCDSCGRPARVRFQPRGDRPVYCSDCFLQQRSGGSYSRY